MPLFNINNNVVSLIRRRMLQIAVHSYIYYELNTNIISDEKWSRWARELVELIKKHPREFKSIKHHEWFEDFDGSTGFQFVSLATPNLITKAYYLTGKLGK